MIMYHTRSSSYRLDFSPSNCIELIIWLGKAKYSTLLNIQSHPENLNTPKADAKCKRTPIRHLMIDGRTFMHWLFPSELVHAVR